MIDIHSHILPSLDDGARDLTEALEMARMAAEDGITHMVATPHMFNGLSHNPEPVEVSRRVEELQAAIGDGLKVLPGNEVHIAHDLVEKARAGQLTPLNQRTYLLVEFPSMNVPIGADELFYRLQVNGITPILVHPERNSQIQNQPSIVAAFVQRGIRIQVTAMSVTGEFGRDALKCVKALIEHQCVHFLATDTHRANRRPPVLSRGRDAVAEIIGPEGADRLVRGNPLAAIEGRAIAADSPIPFSAPQKRRAWRLF